MTKQQIEQIITLFSKADENYSKLCEYYDIDKMDTLIEPYSDIIKILNPILLDNLLWYEYDCGKRVLQEERITPAIIDKGIEVSKYEQFIEYLEKIV